MLHGDGVDTTSHIGNLSTAADLAAASINSLVSAVVGAGDVRAQGELIADAESAWTHAVVADDAAAFFDDCFVHEVSFTFQNDDWYDVLFESHSNDVDDPCFAADVTIDGITMQNVGVRLKGNSSFTGTGIKKSLKTATP
ncbi:hypothetical protein K239x_29430 [Planctomycetes bacterium K23_9]|uniref:Uncharacterized protein n=2 Tax=Stieleria marina TaxID=1930275 RepID=A0A517NV07_9BACT|nr:hypothetical protein K239x_29430 [Planctomycetes bacterium K23_9]